MSRKEKDQNILRYPTKKQSFSLEKDCFFVRYLKFFWPFLFWCAFSNLFEKGSVPCRIGLLKPKYPSDCAVWKVCILLAVLSFSAIKKGLYEGCVIFLDFFIFFFSCHFVKLLRIAKRSHNSDYRELPRWEIFVELELRFGLDLGQLASLKKKIHEQLLASCG